MKEFVHFVVEFLVNQFLEILAFVVLCLAICGFILVIALGLIKMGIIS